MSDLELPFRRLDNGRKYRAKIRLLDGRTVDVRSTTNSPDSSYGLQCWVDRRGNSYGQIDLINPLVAVYDIEEVGAKKYHVTIRRGLGGRAEKGTGYDTIEEARAEIVDILRERLAREDRGEDHESEWLAAIEQAARLDDGEQVDVDENMYMITAEYDLESVVDANDDIVSISQNGVEIEIAVLAHPDCDGGAHAVLCAARDAVEAAIGSKLRSLGTGGGDGTKIGMFEICED